MVAVIFSVWVLCSMRYWLVVSRSGVIRRRKFSRKLPATKPNRCGNTTRSCQKSWNVSVTRHWRSGPASDTLRPTTWPKPCGCSDRNRLRSIAARRRAGSAPHSAPRASSFSGSIAASSASRDLNSSDGQPVKIVPKGWRSFDAHDADFFLELLPGPRDRDSLPDSLRFRKTRIEEADADNTFSVGLIYGPSGCGKSSLVKAGLLPRLSEEAISVYIEATPEKTETRLLRGLRKRCPTLEDNLSLKDTLAALRRGQGIPVGKKVLIILDQFEQWLQTNTKEENTDLVQALRQSDGGRVQCILMVRDDF